MLDIDQAVNPMAGILIKRGKDIQQNRGEDHVKTEAETRVMYL